MPETLNWGILSTAHIGRRALIAAIQGARNGQLLAISSRDPEKARAWAQEFGIPRWYGSYQEMLADAEVQAVYNPLPNNLHQVWTLRAAEAGKHVLCEKPLALDSAETEAMIEGALQAGVVLMEGFMYRFHPQTELALETVRSGRLGQPRLVRSSFSFLLDDPENIRLRPETGGGALYDIGCYCVSACRTFLGQEPSAVRAVARFEDGVDVALAGLLDFPSGALGVIDCSFRQPLRHSYEVVGDEGRLVVPVAFDIRNDPGRVVIFHPRGRGEQAEVIPFEGTDAYRRMVEHFGRAVLEGEPVRYPPREGLANMRVIDALLAAAR